MSRLVLFQIMELCVNEEDTEENKNQTNNKFKSQYKHYNNLLIIQLLPNTTGIDDQQV